MVDLLCLIHKFEKSLKQKFQTTSTRQRHHSSLAHSNHWMTIATRNNHKTNQNKQKLAKFCLFPLLCQEFGRPDITGAFNNPVFSPTMSNSLPTGCFYYQTNLLNGKYGISGETGDAVVMKASNSSGLYNKSSTTQPSSFQILMIIKV